MRSDITTSLTAMLDRMVDDIVDAIAKEGLVLLKRILDEAGFQKSPYLKDYEVYAHVKGNVITFEILLDIESVVPEDEVTRKAIQASAEQALASEQAADSSYALGPSGPQRIVGKNNARKDARRPARDARRPARDARRTSRDRLILKEVANVSPRSAKVDRDGRLSVALKRAAKTVGEEIIMPQNEFQGIIGKFISEISSVVSGSFASGLSDIIGKNVKYLVVKSEVPFAVSIPDMNVHLRGKGAVETVLEESAFVSSDLRDRIAKGWVSVSNQSLAARRMWPTASPVVLPPLPPPAPAPAPALAVVPAPAAASVSAAPQLAVDSDLVRILRGIDDKLGALLTRPSPPPAEVVAAHVRSISALASIPDGLPGAPHPQFIPSTILPEGADAGKTIKVKTEESKVAVDDSVNALKNMRRKST